MNLFRKLLLAAAATLATAVQAGGPALPTVEYSADTRMETAEVQMTGHVNYTPTRERREMVSSHGGERMVMILRHDKKVAWTLMPSEKMYMEVSLAQASAQAGDDLSRYKVEQTVLGPETVNGVNTTKSRIVMTGPKGEQMNGFMWLSKDNILVRMDAVATDRKDQRRIKTELSNLKLGKQDPKLFEVPAGYEKMTMPSLESLMGGGARDAAGKSSAGEPQEKKGFSLPDALKLLK